MDEQQTKKQLDEEQRRDRDVVEEQDFAARNVIMSNALPGGASPAAGAITADRELGLDPTPADEQPTTDTEAATREQLRRRP